MSAELVTRAQAGDRDALGELLVTYLEQSRRYVRRFGYVRHLDEDIVQAVAVAAIEKIGSVAQPDRFAGWLRGVTFKQIMLAHRAVARAPLPLEPAIEDGTLPAAPLADAGWFTPRGRRPARRVRGLPGAAPIDLEDQSFGRLRALHTVASRRQGRSWLCRCACGADVVVRADHLRRGDTRSCRAPACVAQLPPRAPEDRTAARRERLRLTLAGRTQSVAAWSAETGIAAPVIRNRLAKRWPVERALTTPTMRPLAERMGAGRSAASPTDAERPVA